MDAGDEQRAVNKKNVMNSQSVWEKERERNKAENEFLIMYMEK